MEEVVTAGPLLALVERLREQHGALRRAMERGLFEQAATLERERARLMHELFEGDFGLGAAQLREYAQTLLEEQRVLESDVRSQRSALTHESRALHQAQRASRAYDLQAGSRAVMKEKP